MQETEVNINRERKRMKAGSEGKRMRGYIAERGRFMEEKRKSKRSELQSRIIMKRLDDNEREEVAIEVVDLSKSGVGFVSSEVLTIGSTYESYLTIWTKEVLHAFLQIVRIEMKEQGNFFYGASFIGMPEVDASRIEIYQTVNE